MAYFDIGQVVNTQGVRGEIKVIPYTDEPRRFSKLKEIVIYLNNNFYNYKIENVRYHKQFIILKLNGIDTMDLAHSLRGGVIKIPENLALPLGTDEYYIRDIYDLTVVTEDGENLGIIKDIIETGSNDVYVVKKENTKDLLIPAIKQCILNIDINSKTMTVKLLNGLRD